MKHLSPDGHIDRSASTSGGSGRCGAQSGDPDHAISARLSRTSPGRLFHETYYPFREYLIHGLQDMKGKPEHAKGQHPQKNLGKYLHPKKRGH